jgi:YbbR domain-containing protein
MLLVIRKILKSLPSLITALVLALAAWIAAVSASDPNEIHTYSQPVQIEVLGQDTSLIIAEDTLRTVRVTMNAPRSVWQQLNNSSNQIHTFIDLSGLKKGNYRVPIQVQVNLKPVKIVSLSPEEVTLTLEPLISTMLPLQIVIRGEPAVGYQADNSTIEPKQAKVSGPESMVNQVVSLRSTLDLTQAQQNINLSLDILAVDINGDLVDGVTVSPKQVIINQPITQKGGYRNVVVKVVSQGKLADGYRLTNISVYPPNITVFAETPALVENLPGYVETQPIVLDNMKNDISIPAELNLPEGVSLVGNQVVMVIASIEPIESSLTISRISIITTGLAEGYTVQISPEFVDALLSGPLPVLDVLKSQEIQVTIDLAGKGPGTYQVTPIVQINTGQVNTGEIRVESIIPGTIEVVISVITR